MHRSSLWLLACLVAGLCFGPVLGRASESSSGDSLAARVAATEHRLANLQRLMDIDLLDDAAVRERLAEGMRAQAASMASVVRSQLELYQIQHNGQYPDLVGQGWAQLINPTDAEGRVRSRGYGPYLKHEPVNPFNGKSAVVGGTKQTGPSAGWIYNQRTGAIMMVVPRAVAREYGLDQTLVYAY